MLHTLSVVLRAHEHAWQAKVAAVLDAKSAAADAITTLVDASAALARTGDTLGRRLEALDLAIDLLQTVDTDAGRRAAAEATIARERADAAAVLEPLQAARRRAAAALDDAAAAVAGAQAAMKAGVSIDEALASIAEVA